MGEKEEEDGGLLVLPFIRAEEEKGGAIGMGM